MLDFKRINLIIVKWFQNLYGWPIEYLDISLRNSVIFSIQRICRSHNQIKRKLCHELIDIKASWRIKNKIWLN